MEQHIDVLPRIIEPSMMASFNPKHDSIASVDVHSCLNTNNTTDETKLIEESVTSTKETDVNDRFVFFKQNFVIILVMISIMVVIYVFYKFYYYQKNSKQEDTSSNKKQIPKTGSSDKKEKEIVKKSSPTSEKVDNRSMAVEDASKYIHLDEEEDEDIIPEKKESHSQKMTVNDIVHEKYDIPSVQIAVQSLSIDEETPPNTEDRFTYIVSDTEQDKKVSFDDTAIDTMIQSKITNSDIIQPLKLSQQHIERDVDSILKDIKNEEISSNPFILDSFGKLDDTESVKSDATEGSTFSENRNEKLQDIPSEVEEEKKRPKKVSRKPTRSLKIRN